MSGVFPIAKLAVHVAASVGVSKVVGDVIRNNTTVVTTADAAKVWTGGFVIGMIVTEAARKTIDARIAEATEWYANRKTTEDPVALATE